MLCNISVVCLCVIVCFVFFCIIVPVRLSQKQLKVIWCFLIFSLAVFAFFSEPSGSDDLFRHYRKIERFRMGEETLLNSVLIGFQIMCWLVSKTNSNGWLPFGTVIIIGMLLWVILSDYLKEHTYTTKGVLLYYLSVLAGIGIFPIISGIRCALVSTIWGVAFCHFRDKNKTKYYLLIVLCSTIHVIGVLFLVIDLVYTFILKTNDKIKMFIRMGALMVFLRLILNIRIIQSIFSGLINNRYTDLILLKWDQYQEVELSGRVQGLSGALLFSLFIVWVIYIFVRYYKTQKLDPMFLFLIMIALLGTGIDIFYDRLPMAIGILSFPTCNELMMELKGGKRSILLWVGVLVFSLSIFFSAYSMCSHMMFNGVNYSDFWRSLLKIE